MYDVMRDLPGYVLRRASAAMTVEIVARFALLGLRLGEASVLMLIKENPGVSSSTLGKTLGIQRANMAPIIARLEASKLIARTAVNGRTHGLALTPTGLEKAGEAARASVQHEADLLARVPSQHRAHLLPALKALVYGESLKS